MSEKTEQPTAKKLREARDEGNVAKSKDFTQTVLIVAVFGYLLAQGPSIFAAFAEMVVLPASLYGAPFPDAARAAAQTLFQKGALIVLPFLLIVIALGIFIELLQTGIVLAFKALQPSMKKLNPLENLKQMFSMKNLIEFVKSVLKVAILSALVYLLVMGSIGPLMKVPLGGVPGVGDAIGSLMKQLIVYMALAYTVISGFDFVWQRFQWKKQLMMSKDEVQREYKEMEGDPHVKSHRRALAQEIAMGDGVEKTRKASVLVTNPTHVAIALYYEDGETPLPLVLAKGEDLVAQRMMKVAEEEGIPIMRNVELARSLLEQATVEQYVPSELLEPVAEILRVVRALRGEGERS